MPNEKRIEKRYRKADAKIDRAYKKSPQKGVAAEKKYGYDYDSAKSAGLGPDSTGHWPSRNPETGQILKGRKHPTISLTKRDERALGYKITKKAGVLYSHKKTK